MTKKTNSTPAKARVSKRTSRRPSKKDTPKGVSLKEIVTTVVKVVKKPFGGKGRKHRVIDPEIQRKIDAEREFEKHEILEQRETESMVSDSINDLFYTSDKFIDGFEDGDMLNFIWARYPDFMNDLENDSKNRKQILMLLDDEPFVRHFLKYFDMTVGELFKFIYRLNASAFKTSFIVKIQSILKDKKYL